jgi:hypothetical protein
MASITLRDLVEEQEETNMRLDEIDDRFLQFFDMLRADKLDMLEIMSELKDQRPTVPAVPPGAPETKPTPEAAGGLKFGFGTLVTSLGVALTAAWAAYIKEIGVLFRALGRGLGKIPGVGFIMKTVGNIGKYFTNLRRVFAGVDSTMRTASGQFRKMNFFEKGIKSVGAFFRSVGSLFSGFSGGGFMERLKPITDFFGKFKDMFGKLFGIFRAIGRIFLPLTAIIEVGLGIFREVSALEEDATVGDKLMAGVRGIIKGLGRLITMPLDLLKDGISWIAGKLGFDQFSEVLDSFSFTGLFDSLVDGPLKFIKAIGAGTAAAFAAALPGGESPTEAFGRAFSEVMASGEEASVPTTVGGNARRAARASATGAESIDTPPPEEASRPRTRADVRRQRMEARAAEEAGQAPTVTVVNNTNAPTTTTNNSTTTGGGAPLPQPTQSNGSRADAYAGA